MEENMQIDLSTQRFELQKVLFEKGMFAAKEVFKERGEKGLNECLGNGVTLPALKGGKLHSPCFTQ
ncbi:MAG: hypothetical protein ABIK98_11840 [Pseudomonadota bacterium]|uniref:Uncharacterized protein n=1 Tax=Candidatus Desulfatibia profunda TaxID=2841695 RepID=A0A8J6TNA7_9BACT|nr:hypothetical protein [Candidatus Desulfatibia profunda]MBL7179823.1 hypothetical protein [Desulfobacterales bacterium]